MDILEIQKNIWNAEPWIRFLENPSLLNFENLPGNVYFEPTCIDDSAYYTQNDLEEKCSVRINGSPFYWVPAKLSMVGPRKIEVIFRYESKYYSKIFDNECFVIHDNLIMRISSRQHEYYEKTKSRREKLKRILNE